MALLAAALAILTSEVLAGVDKLRAIAREAADASLAPSTEKAYASDWRDFTAFAKRICRERMPADSQTVALYVAYLRQSGRRPATIARKVAVIAVYHGSAGHSSPCERDVVRAVVLGTRRALGVAQRQSTALTLNDLTRALAPIGKDPRRVRDRALSLIGFAAAQRRSELVAIDFEDLWFEEGSGVVIGIRRSKNGPGLGRRRRLHRTGIGIEDVPSRRAARLALDERDHLRPSFSARQARRRHRI